MVVLAALQQSLGAPTICKLYRNTNSGQRG
jgi:hypothetical protein